MNTLHLAARRSAPTAFAVAIALCAAVARAQSGAMPAPTSAPPQGGGVVLELFTSQGCSTCPPADQLLSRLAKEPQWQGRLVPIAWHVDYWNHGGWMDPFSSPDWTARQRQYSDKLSPGEVYTPQAVINGRKACVGSSEADVRRLLAEAAAQPLGRVELHLERKGSKVEAAVVAAPPAGRAGTLDVMLAVVESGLETQVQAGENAHRALHDDFVVRHLERAFKLKGTEKKDSTTLRLERSWKPENTNIAVFLQDPETHEILGGATAPVPQ